MNLRREDTICGEVEKDVLLVLQHTAGHHRTRCVHEIRPIIEISRPLPPFETLLVGFEGDTSFGSPVAA